MPKDLPDDPVLLKQLLEQMLSERESDKGKIVRFEEDNALLRQRLFGCKSGRAADPATPQMVLFNEAERRRRSDGANASLCPPIFRVSKSFTNCPEHELTCACRKHAVGEAISEQREILPMQIRVIKHV